MKCLFFILSCALFLADLPIHTGGQRITTIQLEGTQYFISCMNPYSPQLNYFLAYQYCRSIGLQLVSFETQEKTDAITTFLKNSGYSKYDFWTSGNKLGTGMHIWMSSGLPFNTTFSYFQTENKEKLSASASYSSARRYKRGGNELKDCVALKVPDMKWALDDCLVAKDFVCEQTRCYYYNYGAIPVTAQQGIDVGQQVMPPSVPSRDTVKIPVKDEEVASTVVYLADANAEEATKGPYVLDSAFDDMAADEPQTEENEYSTVDPSQIRY